MYLEGIICAHEKRVEAVFIPQIGRLMIDANVQIRSNDTKPKVGKWCQLVVEYKGNAWSVSTLSVILTPRLKVVERMEGEHVDVNVEGAAVVCNSDEDGAYLWNDNSGLIVVDKELASELIPLTAVNFRAKLTDEYQDSVFKALDVTVSNNDFFSDILLFSKNAFINEDGVAILPNCTVELPDRCGVLKVPGDVISVLYYLLCENTERGVAVFGTTRDDHVAGLAEGYFTTKHFGFENGDRDSQSEISRDRISLGEISLDLVLDGSFRDSFMLNACSEQEREENPEEVSSEAADGEIAKSEQEIKKKKSEKVSSEAANGEDTTNVENEDEADLHELGVPEINDTTSHDVSLNQMSLTRVESGFEQCSEPQEVFYDAVSDLQSSSSAVVREIGSSESDPFCDEDLFDSETIKINMVTKEKEPEETLHNADVSTNDTPKVTLDKSSCLSCKPKEVHWYYAEIGNSCEGNDSEIDGQRSTLSIAVAQPPDKLVIGEVNQLTVQKANISETVDAVKQNESEKCENVDSLSQEEIRPPEEGVEQLGNVNCQELCSKVEFENVDFLSQKENKPPEEGIEQLGSVNFQELCSNLECEKVGSSSRKENRVVEEVKQLDSVDCQDSCSKSEHDAICNWLMQSNDFLIPFIEIGYLRTYICTSAGGVDLLAKIVEYITDSDNKLEQWCATKSKCSYFPYVQRMKDAYELCSQLYELYAFRKIVAKYISNFPTLEEAEKLLLHEIN